MPAPGPTAGAPLKRDSSATTATLSTTPVHIVSPAYELYAPTREAAGTAQVELDHAVSTFRRYFGTEPRALGVVVFPSIEAMRSFDWTLLRERGLRPLPWLVSLGESPRQGGTGIEGTRALSHEACHLYLIGHTSHLLGRSADRVAGAPRTYGDPSLPDWFDEGVATLCEFPVLQAQRIAHLAHVGDRTIPFVDLFRMEHPAFAGLMKVLEAQGAAMVPDSASGGRTQVQVRQMRLPAGGIPGVDREQSLTFYAQAQSLLKFMAEREGPAFVGLLGEALARGQSVEQVLASHARNLPKNVPGFEREWKTWVAANR